MSENSYILVIKFALLLGVPKLCSHCIVDHQRERHIETIKSFFCPISVFLEGGYKAPPFGQSHSARVRVGARSARPSRHMEAPVHTGAR